MCFLGKRLTRGHKVVLVAKAQKVLRDTQHLLLTWRTSKRHGKEDGVQRLESEDGATHRKLH